ASVGNAGGNARPSLTNATLAAARLLHRRAPTAPGSLKSEGQGDGFANNPTSPCKNNLGLAPKPGRPRARTKKRWRDFRPSAVDFCSSRLAIGAATERARALAMPAGTRAQALQTRL